MRLYDVVVVSQHTNTLGLYGMIVRGKCGDIWELGVYSLNLKRAGDVIICPNTVGRPCWSALGYEAPRMIKNVNHIQPLCPAPGS